MEVALRSVEQALTPSIHPSDRLTEMPGGRFVASGLFRRDRPVELDADALDRRGQQIVVDVGQDGDPEA